MGSKTLKLCAITAVLVSGLLLVAFILGWIESEQLQSSLTKTLSVIGVIALISLATMAIAGSKK
jgi:quinol-cytochrome oxidoreductase complex cytochrome b subunit